MVQMRYPYTFAAKFVQFPWAWHWKNGRFIRFTALAYLLMTPVFYKIQKSGKWPYLFNLSFQMSGLTYRSLVHVVLMRWY
jgi:hypothetical protein